MKRYAVADYLHPEEKAAMCAAAYPQRVNRGAHLTAEGCCPLGVAFPEAYYNPSAPTGTVVAETIVRTWIEYGDVDLWIANAAAAFDEFIADWDDGIIRPRDLPTVLGLRRGRRTHRRPGEEGTSKG